MSLTDAERRTLAARSASIWRDVREAAHEAFDAGRAYRIYAGHTVHYGLTAEDIALAASLAASLAA